MKDYAKEIESHLKKAEEHGLSALRHYSNAVEYAKAANRAMEKIYDNT